MSLISLSHWLKFGLDLNHLHLKYCMYKGMAD